jgi:hypothetical protein
MQIIARFMVMLIVIRMAAVPFSAEEIALAQILQGEANHQFMGSHVPAYAVGWVARNRLEAGDYGSSYQELQAGFNGAINRAPQWKYMATARLVMNGKWDPTDGALYVLSQQDVDQLGFAAEEASLVVRASAHRALFFFKDWQQ